ncbi:hypothetical protein [Chryseobacterium oncorhynchi]|uniref:Helix-turn-helix domain containing protein n=1 Tax=Chryseobacterium oncorhynchi TaxID=741074 RepID=A0A316X1N7_9FLAO|nr:hypothetical protein [Chryseobacterium oncorhynchi]PWN67595.1 hypothetical protein C1638_003115 [Chryseobacterium oncorhynchi]
MKAYDVRLSQEQLEQVEDLAGAGYDIDRIAVYLDIPRKELRKEFQQEYSFVRYHYDRGILVVEAETGMKLAQIAKSGNITAIQQMTKLRENQRLVELRKRIMYGEEIDGL